MFDLFGGVFSKFGETWFGSQIDTFVDKLNRNVTVAIMIAMAVLVSAKQYVGDPIHCRHTSVHDGNFEKYMNNICWVTNTYVVPQDIEISGINKDDPEISRINYYQWVPMILLVQAALFYLPHLIWQAMLTRSGLDLKSICATGCAVITADNREEREKKVSFMAGQMDNYLRHYQDMGDNHWAKMRAKCSSMCSCMFGKRGGNFIIFLYLFHKALYMANVIFQILMLQHLLSRDIHGYAWNSFASIFTKQQWPESDIFPRQTICKFSLVNLGNQYHTHFVQCVLSVNFFHEKVFIFNWIWLLIMSIFTGLSLLAWTFRFIFSVDRVRFVKRYLKVMDRMKTDKDRKDATAFILNYLKQDGVFALRLVNLNVSGLVTGQLVGQLWDDYKTFINKSPKYNASGDFNQDYDDYSKKKIDIV